TPSGASSPFFKFGYLISPPVYESESRRLILRCSVATLRFRLEYPGSAFSQSTPTNLAWSDLVGTGLSNECATDIDSLLLTQPISTQQSSSGASTNPSTR
ncbi:MAG: hypothetical protein Q9224_003989, partial [Gallowayella concinna]